MASSRGRSRDPHVSFIAPQPAQPGGIGPGHECAAGKDQTGLVRVVATRIEPDGTMLRRVVDTAARSDGEEWEDLAARALIAALPYRPVPGRPVYHVSIDDHVFLVAEQDLTGPLRDLATAALARGNEI